MNSPSNEKNCQQDTLERLNNLLDLLERRIHDLLDTNDPELMKPVEREQAASRYIMLLLKAFEPRLVYAESSAMDKQQAIIEALLRGGPQQETNAGYNEDNQ